MYNLVIVSDQVPTKYLEKRRHIMRFTRKGFVLFSSLILALMFILSSIPAFAAGVNTWTTKASMWTARGGHQVAVVDGKIYAIGGFNSTGDLNSVEEYDSTTDTWITKASMLTARRNFQVAVVGGKIYAIGGIDNNNSYLYSVEEYDPATNTWTTKSPMTTARSEHQVAVVGGKIYAIGGYNGSGNVLNSVEEYDPVTNTWTTKAPMTTSRCSHQVAVVGEKIYAIGGFGYPNTSLNSVEEYDPATNKWITKALMTTARYEHKLAVMNKKIYAIGGCNSNNTCLNSVEEYDPATDKWTVKAAMRAARYSHEAAVVGDKIYAIGGYNGATLNSVEEYNPATNTWTSKASLTTARSDHQAAVVGDKIYAIGGFNGNAGGVLNSVEEFDTVYNVPESPTNLTAAAGNAKVDLAWTATEGATGYNIKRSTTAGGPFTTITTNSSLSYTDTNVTNGTTYYYVVSAVNEVGESRNSNEVSATAASINSWTTKASMTTARDYHQVAVLDGKIYAIGGYNDNDNAHLKSVEKYDPETNTWAPRASMTTARSDHRVAIVDGKIYVMGGYNETNGYLNSVEKYDPATNIWTSKASMHTARGKHQVAVVGGKIYVIGGWNIHSGALNLVEEYDPTTDTWITKASMLTAREGFQVAVVEGKIYAIGGFNGTNGYLNSVEEYDPATDTWSAKSSMADARYGHQVAVVGGKIYAIGGFNETNGYLNSVEKYDSATNIWTSKASMTTERSVHQVAVVVEKIYAIGGESNSGLLLNSVEEYDSATNTWTSKASMTTARYDYQVAVVDEKIYTIGGYNGSDLNSVEEYATEYSALPLPAILTAKAINAKVDLSWTAVEGATGYNIKRSTTAGGPYTAIKNNASGTTYTDANVSNGTTYYYVVSAVNQVGESGNSNEVSATTLPEALGTIKINFQPAGSEIPQGYIPDYGEVYGVRNDYSYGWNVGYTGAARDRNINADQKLDTLIMLYKTGKWEMAVDNGLYDVTVCVGDAGFSSTPTVNVEGVNYWADINLSVNQYLQVTKTVMVTDGRLTIDNGGTADQITKLNYVEIAKHGIQLQKPVNLQASAAQDTVTLTWDKSYEMALYEVEADGSIYAVTGAAFTHTFLEGGTTHSYRVRTVNGAEKSEWSDMLKISTLPEAFGTIKINFQPAGSEIPQGYIPDYGEIYGVRNGYSYGWNIGYAGATRDRNINADQKLDTLIMLYETGKWEMEVEDGSYDVTVCVGDAGFNSTPTVNVEGVNYWSGINLGVNQYLQTTKTVMVTDGKLTIDNGGTADQITKIDYVKIVKNSVTFQVPITAAEDSMAISWDVVDNAAGNK